MEKQGEERKELVRSPDPTSSWTMQYGKEEGGGSRGRDEGGGRISKIVSAHRVRHSSCLRAMRLSCRTLVCAATVDLFLSVKVCGTATAEGALSKSIIVSRA